MTQNRFKSWALWTSIAALVVFCVKEFAGLDIGETVDGLLNALLAKLSDSLVHMSIVRVDFAR